MNKQINPSTMANLLVHVLSVCNPNCKITNFMPNAVKRILNSEH